MKKLISILMALAMIMVLAACSGSDEEATVTDTAEKTVAASASSNKSALEGKTLVAFFTARNNAEVKSGADALSSSTQATVDGTTYGNAELLAKYATEYTGADVFSIETVDQYPVEYTPATEVAQEEQNENARPKLKETVANMDQYDNIILIYPMWWGDMPMGVWTFLESYDFAGKTIYPISTHLGSGMGSSESTIEKLAKGADVKDGLDVSGSSVTGAEADVQSYLS